MNETSTIDTEPQLNIQIRAFSIDAWMESLKNNKTPSGDDVSSVREYDFEFSLDMPIDVGEILVGGKEPQIRAVGGKFILTPQEETIIGITNGSELEIYVVGRKLFSQYQTLNSAKLLAAREELKPRKVEMKKDPKPKKNNEAKTLYPEATLRRVETLLSCTAEQAYEVLHGMKGYEEPIRRAHRYLAMIKARFGGNVPFELSKQELQSRGLPLPETDATRDLSRILKAGQLILKIIT